jgi:hypothetical protein
MATRVSRPSSFVPKYGEKGRRVTLQVTSAEGYVESLCAIDTTRALIRQTLRTLYEHDCRLVVVRAEVQTGASAADALALSMIPQIDRRAA